MKTIKHNLCFSFFSFLNKKIYIIKFLILISLSCNLFAQDYNNFKLNVDNSTNTDTTKPVQYRRTIEQTENQQSYEQKYFGKDLNEIKRSLFPLESSGVWTELNPKVPRVDYIGVHFVNKDTGWACGDLGALIKTTNGGQDWTVSQTNTTTPMLKVRSYNGQIVIASGYDGLILRSVDGGETFAQVFSGVGSGIDLWGVQMINDTLGVICGLNQTILKTTDAGISWQLITTGINSDYWALDFLNDNYGFVACSGGKILKTNDAGISWAEYQAGDVSNLYAIDVIDSLHIVAAGQNGKNVYSSDGGINWIQNSRLQHDELNSIKFINTETGYTIGTYGGESWGIRKTTNRGVSWYSPPIQNLSEWELELLPDGVGYSAGSDLWINKTTIGYDNWEGLFLNANFVDVFFTGEQTGYAADGRWTGGPLYKTTDGGKNWFGLPNFPSQVFTSTLRCVTFIDSLNGFAGSAPCRIVKTTDAGNSWYIVNSTGLTDTIGLINKIYFINKTTGWAVTTRGGILKTTDAGENWFTQLNAGISVIFRSIHFIDSLYGWTANGAQWPFKTTNGGLNWIQQTNLNIFNLRDIYFIDSLNGFTIKILELYNTNNSGANWFTQLNSQYVLRNFGWLSPTHGFIIGDGVYETNDSGNTWQEISELRNVGLLKFHAPKNYLGYSAGNLGLIYQYIDTSIVPVELLSFLGFRIEKKVQLEWQTATELNNAGFEIQKSNDKEGWIIQGFVPGNGTTTNLNTYTYIDDISLNSDPNYKLFYRLKQIDFDGSYEYSKVIEIEVLNSIDFILHQNFPNPFNSSTIIKYSIPNAGNESLPPLPVTLKVYDILGNEIVVLVSEEKPAGNYEVMFDAVGLASGVYFYKLSSGGNIQTRKLIFMK